MALITTDDVQAWLSTDRLQLEVTDELAEEPTVSAEVLSRVSAIGHDVSGWTTPSTTPTTIKNIVSLRVAAYRILKKYADQDEESAYAVRLLNWAEDMLNGVLDGTVVITGDPLASNTTIPTFYPTDTSSVTVPAMFTIEQEF